MTEEGSDEITHIIQERGDKILPVSQLVSQLALDIDHGF
jgi:hypothetical protein